jgi:drug/metabolite transporter (DMT)-like permease
MTASDVAERAKRLDATTKGIVAISIAMALFVVNDALMKLAGERLPSSETMVLRGIGASVGLVLACLWSGGARSIAGMGRPLVVLRSSLEAIVSIMFLTALAMLPLAEITAIMQLSPLLMALAAVLLLGERVGVGRWTAIVAGFGGVVLIIRPSWEGIETPQLLALSCILLVVFRDLLTRRIGTTVPALAVTLASTVSVVVGGLAVSVFQTWYWPTATELQLLLGASVMLAVGNFLMVIAFRNGGDMTVITPFRYSVILWALLNGWLIWGDVPDAFALVGTAIIVASGLYIVRRDASWRKNPPIAGIKP